MNRSESVTQLTVEAIRQAASEAYQLFGKSDLFAFGLCTHDDVDSVYHVYATRDWVREREDDYPEIGFISVEWTQASIDASFLSLSATMREWASADENAADSDYHRDRTVRFRALVEAMGICRNEGLFDPATLLTVSSTDPDELMVTLACEASKLLNSTENAEAYCQMMG